jgi:hypothetical protein
MVSVRRLLMAGMATLLLAGACTSIAPAGPTIPPINIPTIPPLNLPSIPPINLPSGLPGLPGLPGIPGLPSGLPGLPGFSIPPIDIAIPTGSVPCGLVTSAEVAQILGSTVTDTGDSATNCTFFTPSFATISVEQTSDTDLTGVGFLMGNSATQINVGGNPGLAGTALGFPAVYVQTPHGQLQLLGFLGGDSTDMVNKLQQIAAIAIGRMQ